ncbi:MAG TPA: hypothetical protein VKD71_13590 [Gemmataceae bacterium]|nr:hypothetical protein [Gemmataceae bacterium]
MKVITHPPLASLWAIERLPELGPGPPNVTVRPALAGLTPETAFSVVRDREAGMACISGLWLYHDFLDESHTISQDLPSWYGSYWHGIMHRREPDASNAKYWFRRVEANPVFEALAGEASELGLTLKSRKWDPFAFVDQCERERGRETDGEMTCRRVQLREMQLLFEWCYGKAIT